MEQCLITVSRGTYESSDVPCLVFFTVAEDASNLTADQIAGYLKEALIKAVDAEKAEFTRKLNPLQFLDELFDMQYHEIGASYDNLQANGFLFCPYPNIPISKVFSLDGFDKFLCGDERLGHTDFQVTNLTEA